MLKLSCKTTHLCKSIEFSFEGRTTCVPMVDPRQAEATVPKHLPERVAQAYYAHGLFCSNHPVSVICVISIVIALCSYPLLNVPLPGNLPQIFTTYDSQVNVTIPRWFYGSPQLYVQQIILKTTVSPWTEDLVLTDAFRAPLAESFKLIEIVQNFQFNNNSLSLDNICLHVENIKRNTNKIGAMFPEYNCLLLSPANLWQQDYSRFQSDASLINTIYNYENLAKGKTSISDMLFGLSLKDAGIKRYPLKNKQRVVQFAVTIFLTQNQIMYTDGLHSYLKKLYPLSEVLDMAAFNVNNTRSYIHIYYPKDVNYRALVPLSITYIMIFLYMYFSCRKMEFVKSQICIAFCVLLTVLASLSMTIGICLFFGLEFTGKGGGKEVFPYLVIIVGLENVLVLMKAVVTTDSHLDVKIRVAQGLSKEGWNITKNLLVEVTILTVGLLTFVPAIQEFCIFAIVGLLADFFMQTVFFGTALSLNVRCTEQPAFTNPYYMQSTYHDYPRLPRSRSHPRLASGKHVLAPTRHRSLQNHNITSKRVKVVHFWARTRFVQRGFMISMVVWIAIIIYNDDLIQNFLHSTPNEKEEASTTEGFKRNGISNRRSSKKSSFLDIESKLFRPPVRLKQYKDPTDHTDEFMWLRRVNYDTRRRLSSQHWSTILATYNITLSDTYVTLLPSINLVNVFSPETAFALRNVDEKGIAFQWHSLAAALDPLDFADDSIGDSPHFEDEARARPFIPSSPMEIFMTAVLCVISALVLAYTFIVLYRCICTRNYAEWRASWTYSNAEAASSTQMPMEALPIAIDGHAHQVECIATDGSVIASSCLAGFVKIWDAITGELITNIERDSCGDVGNFYRQTEGRSFAQTPYQYSTSLFSASKLPPTYGFSYDRQTLPSASWQSANSSNLCSSSSPTRTGFNFDSKSKMKRDNIPVWCLDCQDNILVLGCADGTLEFWECTTGFLKCLHRDEDKISISSVKLSGPFVVTAKLNGHINFYKLDMVLSHGCGTFSGLMKHRRSHVRTGSMGSIPDWENNYLEEIRCLRVESVKAHTKPITVLEIDGGKVISGSEDRTIKIFQLDNYTLLYTLHGHYGPITCAFIDVFNPSMAGSGSQDGLLCVWDLHTGACMYSIQAHDGAICALTYSASYVISLGQDDRLCVWDRFQGHLLNTISLTESYCTSMCMLTQNILITSKQGDLLAVDVGTGEMIRLVKLSANDSCVFVRQIVHVGDGVVCDYGDHLRLVRFPFVYDKIE